MRVLFTGASSFTGAWIVSALVGAGHDVVGVFRQSRGDYTGIRAKRVAMVADRIDCLWNTEVGDGRFLDLAGSRDFDVFCHHAAEMTDYRSWDFDPLRAAAANTRNIRATLDLLARRGCRRTIVTGSVFEPYEGVGDPTARAFNPYGLSKHVSYEIIRMEAERIGVRADKLVIPNPFGPLEEPRFTTYLATSWLKGEVPSCRTPDYIRDNIHVSHLATDYLRFCERDTGDTAHERAAPSGYVESQGNFAARVAREFAARTGRETPLDLPRQTAFDEPLVRVNPPGLPLPDPDAAESAAWDRAVDYWTSLA
jgi:nucleoside-diphosphate-sugar epimerase